MTPERARRARAAATVVASVAFAVAAHFAIVEGLTAQAGALLSLVPLGFLLLWLARRSSRPQAVVVLVIVAAIIAWLEFPVLKAHFPSLFFVEHAGGQLILAFVFGSTLVGGREPLVTRFAMLVHGELPAGVARYTRHVTVAWTVFFCVLFTLSCALYLGGFIAAWSLLANILSPVLVCAMFAVEYIVRYRVFPDWERVGVLGGIQAFSRHFGTAQPQSRG
ncbi:MAG TPA: hypothetical protein VM051_10335 [Usitatibacter sp.]|nr:hypothetical protein [Usitatibacter sp.]